MLPDSNTIIEGWLEAIDVSVLSTTALTSDIVLQVNDGDPPPTTPRQHRHQVIEEASPTDTSFSATTIFDTPVHKPQHSNHGPSSDYDSLEIYSDNTPIYNEDDKEAVAEEQDTSDWAITPDEANTVSTDTEETSSSPLGTTISLQICEQKEMVRIVSLTSCLQCIHLHLPCSRTYPHCTRCARNGHVDVCLLHRRRFASEFGRGGGPVLLKVKGDKGDDGEVWKRKMELREVMNKEWAVKQERKNWVLPNPLGETSGWQKRGVWVDEGEGYPGEGEGRVVLRELVVELED